MRGFRVNMKKGGVCALRGSEIDHKWRRTRRRSESAHMMMLIRLFNHGRNFWLAALRVFKSAHLKTASPFASGLNLTQSV